MRPDTLGPRAPSIFIPVHWLTDFGGLHENVLDTVRALRGAGCRIVVMAPAARFNPRFVAAGATLIENDLSDAAAATHVALAAGPFSLGPRASVRSQ